MMLHCRQRNPTGWTLYLAYLGRGAQFEAFYKRDWDTFKREMLDPTGFRRAFETVDMPPHALKSELLGLLNGGVVKEPHGN